ncbi:hypothetical protein D3C87_1760050 [compost metagenome]
MIPTLANFFSVTSPKFLRSDIFLAFCKAAAAGSSENMRGLRVSILTDTSSTFAFFDTLPFLILALGIVPQKLLGLSTCLMMSVAISSKPSVFCGK